VWTDLNLLSRFLERRVQMKHRRARLPGLALVVGVLTAVGGTAAVDARPDGGAATSR